MGLCSLHVAAFDFKKFLYPYFLPIHDKGFEATEVFGMEWGRGRGELEGAVQGNKEVYSLFLFSYLPPPPPPPLHTSSP